MTMVPYGPLWCWNVQGEDVVYFSQPTLAPVGPRPVLVSERTGCVARCQFQSWLEEMDGSTRTHAIQCGRVPQLTRDGEYRCTFHHPERLQSCAWCDELAATGSTKACPGCHATWKEAGLPDFCCPPEEAPWT